MDNGEEEMSMLVRIGQCVRLWRMGDISIISGVDLVIVTGVIVCLRRRILVLSWISALNLLHVQWGKCMVVVPSGDDL